jgi:plasmid stability protein
MHTRCMPSTLLQIRGLDPSTRDELKIRAARRGQSLTAYVRDLLEREASTPDLAEVLDRVDRRAGGSTVSSVDLIRADRDGR